MKNSDYNIQALIESKDYETLTSEELHMVSRLYSEDEYRDMRDTVLQFKEAFIISSSIVPQSESLERLNSRFDEANQDNKTPSLFMRIITYRIPLYQPVAASLLLLMGYFIFLTNAKPDPITITDLKTEEVIITRTIRDTVYISKPEIITQIKNVYVQTKPTKEPKPSIKQYIEAEQPFIPKVNIPDNDEITSSFGNTSINQEQAEQFKVSL